MRVISSLQTAKASAAITPGLENTEDLVADLKQALAKV